MAIKFMKNFKSLSKKMFHKRKKNKTIRSGVEAAKRKYTKVYIVIKTNTDTTRKIVPNERHKLSPI